VEKSFSACPLSAGRPEEFPPLTGIHGKNLLELSDYAYLLCATNHIGSNRFIEQDTDFSTNGANLTIHVVKSAPCFLEPGCPFIKFQ